MRTIESKLIDDPTYWAIKQFANNKKVVFTNGCFDLLHPGHVAYLQAARQLGEALIVGINDDASVRSLKGLNRPVLPLASRIRILAALESVDAVTPLYGLRNIKLLSAIEPDLWVKGGDYTLETLDAQEVETARRIGIEIKFIPITEATSTTALLRNGQLDFNVDFTCH